MKSCYDTALQYITRFPNTERELHRYLQKKGFEDERIDEAIALLKKQGYVDDELYVSMYIQSEVVRKGRPLLVIQNKLYHKGVEKDLLNHVIDEHSEEIETGMLARLQKEIERYIQRGFDKQKIIQKCGQKGYQFDLINKAVSLFDI